MIGIKSETLFPQADFLSTEPNKRGLKCFFRVQTEADFLVMYIFNFMNNAKFFSKGVVPIPPPTGRYASPKSLPIRKRHQTLLSSHLLMRGDSVLFHSFIRVGVWWMSLIINTGQNYFLINMLFGFHFGGMPGHNLCPFISVLWFSANVHYIKLLALQSTLQ